MTDEPKRVDSRPIESMVSRVSDHEGDLKTTPVVGRPKGWIYKGFHVCGTELWFASPMVQLLMISVVCFLCPGMFNALSGLGGAGLAQEYAWVGDNSNVALYSTFAAVGFFAGTITNRLGLRPALAVGGIGYCIYSAAILCFKHTHNTGFVIFAGAFLGLSAALLWTAQGAIIMSYPSEQNKGRYISIFWVIFNMGGVIGSIIPLVESMHHKESGAVGDGTYAAFIILMFIGAGLSLLLCNADKVIRNDNSKVIVQKNPSWASELKGLWTTLYSQPWIVLLFPMFFCSNIFYTYQNNGMNNAHFNTRTRSLNGLLYWLAQIVGAMINGWALDYAKVRRTTRARASFVALVILTFAIWGGGWAWQKNQPPRHVTVEKDYVKIDFTDGAKAYVGPMILYFAYGMYDAIWQTCIYWYMGAMSNSSRKAANMAGFYKGIQSVGSAVFWRLDAIHTPFNTLFGATWGLLGGSLLIAAPVIFMKIQDSVSLEEDLKDTDATKEEVMPDKVIDSHV